MNCAVELL